AEEKCFSQNLVCFRRCTREKGGMRLRFFIEVHLRNTARVRPSSGAAISERTEQITVGASILSKRGAAHGDGRAPTKTRVVEVTRRCPLFMVSAKSAIDCSTRCAKKFGR